METKGALMNWKLSLAETLSFGITIAILVYFITNNFQSKDDATKLEKRIEKVENELSALRTTLTQISSDISYIRGRLEPKSN